MTLTELHFKLDGNMLKTWTQCTPSYKIVWFCSFWSTVANCKILIIYRRVRWGNTTLPVPALQVEVVEKSEVLFANHHLNFDDGWNSIYPQVCLWHAWGPRTSLLNVQVHLFAPLKFILQGTVLEEATWSPACRGSLVSAFILLY